ncbi:MAG TPA: ABC transporter ATP-binding protein, partial [Aliiroseovarius sp.]|nr:ABC transporter ATP-binding protein [Aliiroseovarius sp.]
MARLELNDITKSYDGNAVLKGISLAVEDGEFLSLVGESGCGKSTLLRILSGLEQPDGGEIAIGARQVNDLAPKARNIAMVFQDYALYPHMSVAENMSMPLLMTSLPLLARLPLIRRLHPEARRAKPQIAGQVEKVARQLRIDHLLERKPAQLSGGQRQRVALGRALVRDPDLFLMDEPLSNLDAKLRVQVRQEISALHKASGLTFIYVTHDQVEAMTMSDRVALLDQGRLLQVDTPNQLYANPASLDVARFIGSPEINTLPARLTPAGLELAGAVLPARFGTLSGDVQIALRPEALVILDQPELAPPAEAQTLGRLGFRPRLIEDLGPEVLIHGAFEGEPELDLRIRAQKSAAYHTKGTL